MSEGMFITYEEVENMQDDIHMLATRNQELEKQNEELIELLGVIKDRIEDFEYDVNSQSCIADTIEETLEKIKQKPIEEILK